MAARIIQDYKVYKQDNNYFVIGDVDGKVVCCESSAFKAIQTTVDALQDQGGTILLSRGIYILDQAIRLESNVMLRGNGRGTKLVVAGDIGVLSQGCKGIVIADLEVVSENRREPSAGIVLDDCGDCQVRDVFVHSFRDYGMWLRNNSFLCELKSCKVADNGKANIYMDRLGQGGRGGDFVPNLIANCMTYGGNTGIECRDVIVLNIIGCAVFQPAKYAYYLHHTSNSVLISGCRSFQVGEHAVVVESTHELNITGNIFCWHRGNGLVLRDVSWGTITGNEFIDQGVRTRDGSYKNGLVIEQNTQGVQVVGNTIFNWGDQCPMQSGIVEDNTCLNNTIAKNNINYYIEYAVCSEGVGTLVTDNVCEKEQAYQGGGRPPYPDFTTDKLEQFIIE